MCHKGVLRDGTEFAAKVLSSESEQGIKEFLAEIESISEVKHANLVRLLGCCVQGRNRILVYEYLANNSLDQALKGECVRAWIIHTYKYTTIHAICNHCCYTHRNESESWSAARIPLACFRCAYII